jgi:4a-hydroxytetrahydrobiopterin dehydratase
MEATVTKPDILTPEAADAALQARHLAWKRDGDILVRVVERGDFAGALAYVNRVAELAEAANHHPDIDIRWGTVTLRLTTHWVGGLTVKDLDLAAQIDRLADEPTDR